MSDSELTGRRRNLDDATWVEYFVDASGPWLMYHFPGNNDPSNRVPEPLDVHTFTLDERSAILVENHLRERFGRVVRREHGPPAIVATWELDPKSGG